MVVLATLLWHSRERNPAAIRALAYHHVDCWAGVSEEFEPPRRVLQHWDHWWHTPPPQTQTVRRRYCSVNGIFSGHAHRLYKGAQVSAMVFNRQQFRQVYWGDLTQPRYFKEGHLGVYVWLEGEGAFLLIAPWSETEMTAFKAGFRASRAEAIPVSEGK